jgi:hypothetical protein
LIAIQWGECPDLLAKLPGSALFINAWCLLTSISHILNGAAHHRRQFGQCVVCCKINNPTIIIDIYGVWKMMVQLICPICLMSIWCITWLGSEMQCDLNP